MNENPFAYTNPASPEPAPVGALAGLQVAIQPNLTVRGWPTDAGSSALERFVALQDATVVERLNAAGARIAGLTHMAELGLGLDGDTAAAAVVSSRSNAALMTDTFGEPRVAAAEAGLMGFRPTVGTVSRFGLIGLIPSMEALGVVSRDAGTIASIMGAISGPDDRDFSLGGEFPDATAAAVSKVAVIPQALAGLDAEEIKAFEAALAVLKTRGVSVVEAPAEDWEMLRLVHQAIGAAEASSSAGKYDSVRYGHRASKADDWNEMYLKSREESFGPLVKAFLFQGAYFQFKGYPAFEDACRIRRRLVRAFDDILSSADVIVMPTRRRSAVDKAGAISQVYDRFALTLAANVAGLPAVNVPGFVMAGADDIGLQLMAGRLKDNTLLHFAGQLLSTQVGDR